MKPYFVHVDFLACQILSIDYILKLKGFYFLMSILTILRRCHLQLDNLF
jgi:hypothetical protein